MKLRKTISLLLLLGLLLTLAACGDSIPDDTTPSTGPTETFHNPTEPPETTAPTQPEETEPPTEPEETQPQSREPEGTRMSLDQLQMLQWKLAEDEEHWYTVLFGTTFTQPSEIYARNFFGNGIPGSSPAELTQEEQAFILEQEKETQLHYPVYRISREKAEEVLGAYLGLSPEEIGEVNWTGMSYLESTDCYYRYASDSMIVWPIFREGYILDENTRVIYYTHYSPKGSDGGTLYRAVLWEDPEVRDDAWKILEVTKAEP